MVPVKLVVLAIVGFVALIALVIYAPIAFVREVSRSEDEVLQEWMGTVKARRARLRVIIAVMGLISITAVILAACNVFDTSDDNARNEPLSGTVEALCAQVDELPAGTTEFELFVPGKLTWRGEKTTEVIAVINVEARLQSKNLYRQEYVPRPTGCLYKYSSSPPIELPRK